MKTKKPNCICAIKVEAVRDRDGMVDNWKCPSSELNGEGLCGIGTFNFICRHKLEIPDKVDVLFFSLYRTPGVHRIPLDVRWCSAHGEPAYPELFDKRGYLFDDSRLDKRLKKWVGKKVYLEVEYLEP